MAKKQSQIDKVTQLKDQASAKFEKAVTASEKKIFDEAVTLIRELETTPDGKIKASVANLKRLAQIRTKLAKVANNKEYLKAVKELAGEFDAIYQAQAQYFSTLTSQMHHESKYATMKQLAVENTVGGLSGAGLQANVTDKLNDMLLRAVTSGAKYADLIEEMRTYLKGDGEHPGALTRYASTYTVTALSQYAGQNNKLLTDDLGCEWFEYVGSEIETTREFCDHLCDKRYIHKSEIPEILKGHIDGHKCKIYAKTGLPYGLIEGTTPENFQVNVGGWNCRHQLVPIAKEAVPPEIRARFEKPKEEPQQQTTSKDWEEFMADPKYGPQTRAKLTWKRVFPELDTRVLEDRTASMKDLISAHYSSNIEFSKLQRPLWDAQAKLKRTAKKAADAGRGDLSSNALTAIENSKAAIPSSREDFQSIVSNLETMRTDIENALKEAKPTAAPGKQAPAQKTPSEKLKAAIKEMNKATQEAEVTPDDLELTKEQTEAEQKKIRAEFIKEKLGVSEETAIEMTEALRDYTTTYYFGVRAAQSGHSMYAGKAEYEDKGKLLEEFIAKSPKWKGATTYRGIGVRQSVVDGLQKAYQDGTPIEQYGTSSWTLNRGKATKFSKEEGYVRVVFVCRDGQPQGTSIRAFSAIENEQEILCSKDARWIIKGIKRKSENYYEVEVTPYLQ